MTRSSALPRLLLDCDEVLSDFISGWLDIINRSIARLAVPWTPLGRDDVDGWNIFGALRTRFPASIVEEIEARCRAQDGAPGYAQSLQVLPGAKAAVARLARTSDLHVVTSPSPDSRTWARDREDWLLYHFGIPATRVHHTRSKHLIGGDVFVDDKPENVATWVDANPLGIGILWAGPKTNLASIPTSVEERVVVAVRGDWNVVETAVAVRTRRAEPALR